MKFYTANGLERPVRLSDSTSFFAYESLNHKYGLDTRKTDSVILDDIENFDKLTELERYDAAIAKIASDAPIRICDGEKISGAATLGRAIDHTVPASYKGNYGHFRYLRYSCDNKKSEDRSCTSVMFVR